MRAELNHFRKENKRLTMEREILKMRPLSSESRSSLTCKRIGLSY